MTFTAAEHGYMARALELAARGLYSTHPNPRVGCVLVREGRVVGEGYHRRAGEAHAEVQALRAAGPAARGATCYVSLEPCCHYGRTPPCTEALVEAGVGRVVAAMEDPNPAVHGRGLARLREAGIPAVAGLLESEALGLNRGFVRRLRAGRPFVRLKAGVSLDGRTAAADGRSQWVTGEAARADVQRLRAESGAILTGVGTVLADDPRLTVRAPGLDTAGRQPLRVVVDSHLRTPPTAQVLHGPGQCLLAHAAGAAAHRYPPAVELWASSGSEDRVDLAGLLGALAARGVGELLVEAGPGLAGALLAAGLVDELVLYVAPRLFGEAARGLAALGALRRLEDSVELQFGEVRRVGADLRILAVPRAS